MLTRNGWTVVGLAIGCLALGVVLGYVELIAVGIAFVLMLVLAALWMIFRPNVEVTRSLRPFRVVEGERAGGLLTVRNIGRRRCPPVVAVEAFERGSVTVPLASLAPGAENVAIYDLPTDRRGTYAVGPLEIGFGDPFGLVNTSKSHGAEATLWVHPLVHKIEPIPTGRSQDLEGPMTLGAPSGGIAFHTLREYEPGDDPRLIHWRSTAKSSTGDLMVRHTVVTNEPRVLIVLDTSAEPYAGESFEDAVRVAASLIDAATAHGYPVEFRTTGGIAGSIDPTGHGRLDVFDKLSSVQTSDDDPGLRSLVTMAAKRQQGVAIGVVTGQPEIENARSVGAIRPRFEMVTLAQVGEKFGRPAFRLTGVLAVNGETSDDFARAWRSKVG